MHLSSYAIDSLTNLEIGSTSNCNGKGGNSYHDGGVITTERKKDYWLIRVTLVAAYGFLPQILGSSRDLWMVQIL